MVTTEESIPSISDAYQSSKSVFYQQFNAVDFYVEDEDSENFYHCILAKLFPNIRLENIFPLRGKQKLIQHATTAQPKRKSVYLLDKDFDDLLGRTHKQTNVFYLEKYCIENFLLEEKALIRFIVSEKPRLKLVDVKRDLKFQSTWDEIVKLLSKPFAMFYVVQKYNIASLKNTSHEPDCFCLPTDKCSIDEQKVSDYAKQVKRKASIQGVQIDMVEELKTCSGIFEFNSKSKLQGINVSGEFILCLFAHRIFQAFKLSHVPDLKSFAFRLAQECDLNSLHTLRAQVNSFLKDG